MPLVTLDLPHWTGRLPREVRTFLREAERRIQELRRHRSLPGFVPSDFETVYAALRGLTEAELAPGSLFCEWGSGLGVVACLAAMLDYDACGIEVEGELVDAARQLADDFGLPVEFVRGSFIPPGDEAVGEYAWLTQDGEDTFAELGLVPEDFGVIFAFPWPDEERLIGELFERHAATGALLLTHHASVECCLRRKEGETGPGGGKGLPPLPR